MLFCEFPQPLAVTITMVQPAQVRDPVDYLAHLCQQAGPSGPGVAFVTGSCCKLQPP